jgi:co-chaperonin GroES (HSP10)
MAAWQTTRPLHKWIIVKADPRVKKSAGGIHLPDGQVMAERVMEGTGRILKLGNRDEIFKACSFHLEPGMRICYRGFLKDAWKEYFDREDDCDVFLLAASDVLAVIDDSVQMGFLS